MRLSTTSELLKRLDFQISFLRIDVRDGNEVDPLSVESFQQTHDALVESLTRILKFERTSYDCRHTDTEVCQRLVRSR